MKTSYQNRHPSGFTIIELLITLLISSVVMGSIMMIYQSQQKSTFEQKQIVRTQQTIRASRSIMTSEIRMAGFDPADTLNAAITIISNNASITFRADDGTGATVDRITFSIDTVNNTLDRAIDSSILPGLPNQPAAGIQTLADNIEALGFAYAFDSDGDGDLDTYNAGTEQIIWAIDSDGDNDLDKNLDTDGDGFINENDLPAPGLNGVITGIALTDFTAAPIPDVPIEDIRAVRIWLLASTNKGRNKYVNNFTYTVGNQVISPGAPGVNDGDPGNDNKPMRLSDVIVRCKNMGLKR